MKENIAKAEQEFPRLFACYEERPYGTLFYNTKIKNITIVITPYCTLLKLTA